MNTTFAVLGLDRLGIRGWSTGKSIQEAERVHC